MFGISLLHNENCQDRDIDNSGNDGDGGKVKGWVLLKKRVITVEEGGG